MRYITLISLMLLSSKIIHAQQADSLYIVTYTTGSAWDIKKSPAEQVYFSDHSAHMSKLRKEGTTKIGARYADKGIIIISAPAFQSAREIIHQDPAVINKLFDADVQKLSVFYYGCLEKPQ